MHSYGVRLDDFTIGDRVALHPVADAFAEGRRYGTVQVVGRKWIHVRHDDGVTRRYGPTILRKL